MNKFKIGDEVVNIIGTIGVIKEIALNETTILVRYQSEKKAREVWHSPFELTLVRNKGADKFDDGKPDLSLIDRSLVEAAARALMFGEKKYSRDNWKKGLDLNRCYAALLRHTFASLSGEKVDKESGLKHTDHMAACMQFITYYSQGDANE